MKDYYEILGISKTATEAEIKSAYRKKALEWHPDRNKSPEASEKFKEVSKAYEVLSNPQKKAMYDQYGHSAFERGAGNNPGGPANAGGNYRQGPFTYTYTTGFGGEGAGFDFGGFDPFDIFEQFFGGQSSPYGRRTRNPIFEAHITFEEAMKGVEKTLVISGEQKNVKIPAGVDDGNRIRFATFDVLIRIKPHSFFKREGHDIYYEKEISYPLAVLGGVVEVPTVGKPVKLKIRPGTKPGSVVRLRGQGAPIPNSNRHGDQYVVYQIHVPEHVNNKAKKLLEDLEKELS